MGPKSGSPSAACFPGGEKGQLPSFTRRHLCGQPAQIWILLSPDKHSHTYTHVHTHSHTHTLPIISDAQRLHNVLLWTKPRTPQVKNFCSTNLPSSQLPLAFLPSFQHNQLHSTFLSFSYFRLTRPARHKIPAEDHFNGDLIEGYFCFPEGK